MEVSGDDKPDMSVISTWLALSRSIMAAFRDSSDIDWPAIAAVVCIVGQQPRCISDVRRSFLFDGCPEAKVGGSGWGVTSATLMGYKRAVWIVGMCQELGARGC
jgi:hypothetical protein